MFGASIFSDHPLTADGLSMLTSTLIAAHENDGPAKRLIFGSSWWNTSQGEWTTLLCFYSAAGQIDRDRHFWSHSFNFFFSDAKQREPRKKPAAAAYQQAKNRKAFFSCCALHLIPFDDGRLFVTSGIFSIFCEIGQRQMFQHPFVYKKKNKRKPCGVKRRRASLSLRQKKVFFFEHLIPSRRYNSRALITITFLLFPFIYV